MIENQKKYYDKVVEIIVDGSTIEYGEWYENIYYCDSCGNEWVDSWHSTSDDRCPNCNTPNMPTTSILSSYKPVYINLGFTSTVFEADSLPSLPHRDFKLYCEDNFGLNKDEINYVWSRWKSEMKSIIKDQKNKDSEFNT